ncbi:methylmalonyl-CoA mutase, partial [bacterium]|nr:methylmalonyl-CoA mutase [bacterium]
TQSLHTNSSDEALGLPTENSARVALRTQQVIACESGVTETVDPLAGSYFVEHLTDEIHTKAEALISKIDAMGGSVPAIEQGFFQTEIAAAAYRAQLAIEKEEQIIVGVNKYKADFESPHEILKVDPKVGLDQAKRLQELRSTRDQSRVNELLSRIESAARGNDNLMPVILAAVRRYATLGEISDVLRNCWGEYQSEAV